MTEKLFLTAFALMALCASVVSRLRKDRGALDSPPAAIARVFGPIVALIFGMIALSAWSGALATSSSNDDIFPVIIVCALLAAFVAMLGYEFYLLATGQAVRPPTTPHSGAQRHSHRASQDDV